MDGGVISQVLKTFVPFMKLFGEIDLLSPVADKVKVLIAEPTCLLLGPDDEVIVAFFEEPFLLFILKSDSTLIDFIQLDHIAWRVRELVLVLV